MTLTLLPSSEGLLTAFLRAQDEVYAIVGGRVYTEPPSGKAFPLVFVRRTAGGPIISRPRYIDAPLISLHCYADDITRARTLANTCCAAIAERIEGVHSRGVVSGVDFGAFYYLPDEDYSPAQPRYIADVTLTVHP